MRWIRSDKSFVRSIRRSRIEPSTAPGYCWRRAGISFYSLGDTGIDITGVEQRRDHRVDCLMRLDLIRVDAAKDQQVIILRQVV
jgi:hypothetical protein